MLVVGQAGLGKSNFIVEAFLQDADAGGRGVFVDPHDSTTEILRRIPEHRRNDVVLVSLVQAGVPIWPLMNVAHRPDEILVVADHLIDAWRALSGEQSIGPRAESIIKHALLLIAGASDELLTPLELATVLSSRGYQTALMEEAEKRPDYWPLYLFWDQDVPDLGPRGWKEWAQSTQNKVDPLLVHPWLRRATAGIAPITAADLRQAGPELLDDPRLIRVLWVRDGVIIAILREDGEADPVSYVVRVGESLEPWLIDNVSLADHHVRCRMFPNGRPALSPVSVPDTRDPALQRPTAEELAQYGDHLAQYVARRRRRRGWTRRVEYDFLPRGVEVNESIDIGDLLDDGKLVLVEIPEIYGSSVTETIGTFALLASVLSGIRALALPPARRVPVSIYIDEAEKFMSRQMDVALAQLRKAGVALTLSVQRLGQLGVTNAALRRGIVDTVGTMVVLGPGLGEVPEVAELLGVKSDELFALERGQGIVSGLNEHWAREKPVKFDFPPMRTIVSDQSIALRQSSSARYTQTVEDAELGYKVRQDAIRRLAAAGAAKAKSAAKPSAKRAKTVQSDPKTEPTGSDDSSAQWGPDEPETQW
ncbi:MAG: type IV secretory system conjugative DNA transfer family protein [Candidatus Dormibacteria bacterium]